MDALQQQQQPHHRFMGAPPPPPPPPPQSSMSDLQQPPRPQAPPPPPPQGTWYPNQFQYNASQPPPPSHPHHSTWPNHSDHQQPFSSSSYHTPNQYNPAPPYPTHPPPPPPPPQHQNQYYPPPPPPPPQQQHASYSQAYPPPNTHQAWGNSNWAHNQVWDHPDRNNPNSNEEDWAAKARAWSAAKSAMDSQHQPLQFTPIGRPEDHNNGFPDQYQRTVDPHYGNIQQSSLPASSHQQFSVPMGDPHRVPVNHLQEPSPFSSESSSYYASDMHVPYTNRDGALGPDPNSLYPHHGSNTTNSSGYQQEVPSSYSSVPGERELGSQGVQLHGASPLSTSSGQETQYHVNSTLPASGRSVSEEQPYFTYGAGSAPDPSDRPLEFAPGFNRNHESHSLDQQHHSSYMHPDPAGHVGYADHGTVAPSLSAVTPSVVPGMGYSPSGLQFDPSFVSSAPMFGQIPGPSYRPNIPTGGAAFGLCAGTVLHPTAAFPGDLNGVSVVSDRPKKASVPDWLREEIIKSKAVIASSSHERLEEDPDSHTEDDNIEKSFVKHRSADNKSIDSSRSSEDEAEDEDAIEAARTAAVNKEIKRVLTEVLLKVTDELFDEIATKVLNEDSMAVEVDRGNSPPNQKLPPSPPAVQLPKASAKVLVPFKAKETKLDDAIGKSPSGSAGDVLGLGSYASDDDDDYDGTESSSKSNKGRDAAPPLAGTKLSEDIYEVVENGGSQLEIKGPSETCMDDDQAKTDVFSNPTPLDNGLRGNEFDKNLKHEKDGASVFHKGDTVIQEGRTIAGGESMEATNNLKLKDAAGDENLMKADLPRDDVGFKPLTDDSNESEARSKSVKNQENRSNSSKDSVKEVGSGNSMGDPKHSGNDGPRREERHVRKEKADDRNGMKERVRDRGTKSGDKSRESDSRRSHSKDDKAEIEKVKKDGAKDDSSRKRVREKDEKEDRSRHYGVRDSSSHKRRQSPSVGGRARSSRDNESTDEASEDSRRRKKHSRKRSLSPSPTRSRKHSSSPSPSRSRKRSSSPSPTRSRRRQVSRSPHSKHSHRRQSPYSSLESKRGRRSRSNSPVRRRR